MKRADWKWLKILRKPYFSELPLLVIPKHTESFKAKLDKNKDIIAPDIDRTFLTKEEETKSNIESTNNVFYALKDFTYKEFLILNQNKIRMEFSDKKYEIPEKYMHIIKENNEFTYTDLTPKMNGGLIISNTKMALNDPYIYPHPSEELLSAYKRNAVSFEDTKIALSNASNDLLYNLLEIAAFLKTAEEDDRYAFKIQGKTNENKKRKNPKFFLRTDLISIVYLNHIPDSNKPHQGGHHASPRPHQRRGCYKTLKDKRYKNHPLYQKEKAIYCKPAYVGDKSKIVNGTTYTIIH